MLCQRWAEKKHWERKGGREETESEGWERKGKDNLSRPQTKRREREGGIRAVSHIILPSSLQENAPILPSRPLISCRVQSALERRGGNETWDQSDHGDSKRGVGRKNSKRTIKTHRKRGGRRRNGEWYEAPLLDRHLSPQSAPVQLHQCVALNS